MASLTYIEKQDLDRILVSAGYVLDFSDRTFWDFVQDYTSLDIHDEKYQTYWTSKGKKLRAFLEKESDMVVASLLLGFVEALNNEENKKKVKSIADRLKGNNLGWVNIELVVGKTQIFNLLKTEILSNMNQDKYIESLDRIHTLFRSYLVEVCAEVGIIFESSITLNGLLGKVKKYLIDQEKITVWTFSETTLSKIIQILENYNEVRNNRSLAHTNSLLSYKDAKFAVNIISSCLSYIDSLI
jgi:hypothetical protein